MKISGAEIFIESLKREGVKHIFGYPGGVVLNIFDLLYDNKDIQLILTRHEQGQFMQQMAMRGQQGSQGLLL